LKEKKEVYDKHRYFYGPVLVTHSRQGFLLIVFPVGVSIIEQQMVSLLVHLWNLHFMSIG